jgi:hypothetical protein
MHDKLARRATTWAHREAHIICVCATYKYRNMYVYVAVQHDTRGASREVTHSLTRSTQCTSLYVCMYVRMYVGLLP